MFRIQRMRSVGTRNRTVGIAGYLKSIPVPIPAAAAFAAAFHPLLCRSDAANSVPCNPGDSIRWMYDLISKTWFEQATSGNRYVMQKDAGSGKYYGVYTANAFHQFGWVANPNVNGNKYTVGVGIKSIGATNTGVFYELGNGTNAYCVGAGTAFIIAASNYDFVVNAASFATFGAIADGRIISESTTGPVNMTWNVYNSLTALTGSPTIANPSANAAGITLGASSGRSGKTLASGNVFGIVGYTDVSSAIRSAGDAWLQSIMP